MTHEKMNERERLKNLKKKLVERERQANIEVVNTSKKHVIKVSTLRTSCLGEEATREPTLSSKSSYPLQALETTAPVVSESVTLQEVRRQRGEFKEGLERVLSNLSDATFALKSEEPLSDDVIDALKQLGIALDIPKVFDRLLEGFNEQREIAPEDRYSAILLALDLRAQHVSWREVTERVNAAGYRNTNGDLWKLWALRRTCIRFAERKGEVIAKTRS